MISVKRVVSLLTLLMLLAACAAVDDRPDTAAQSTSPSGKANKPVKPSQPVGWARQQQQRQQIRNWEIRGRLAIATETNAGAMDVIWKQAGDEYAIRLIAALGSGTYLIQGNDRYAEIRYPDGSRKTIDDVDQAFQAALELELPVSALRDWVRGLPAQQLSKPRIHWNRQGLIASLDQSGWHVEMKKYTGAELLFPHSLDLSHRDDDELKIRFRFRQWLLDN